MDSRESPLNSSKLSIGALLLCCRNHSLQPCFWDATDLLDAPHSCHLPHRPVRAPAAAAAPLSLLIRLTPQLLQQWKAVGKKRDVGGQPACALFWLCGFMLPTPPHWPPQRATEGCYLHSAKRQKLPQFPGWQSSFFPRNTPKPFPFVVKLPQTMTDKTQTKIPWWLPEDETQAGSM